MGRRKGPYFTPEVPVHTYNFNTRRQNTRMMKLHLGKTSLTKPDEALADRGDTVAEREGQGPTFTASSNPMEDACTTETEDVPGSAHAKRKLSEAHAWLENRDKLIPVRRDEFGPATSICSICGTDSAGTGVVRCTDCGPFGYYCRSCDIKIHGVVLWHQSHIWVENPGMYVPHQRQTELHRLDGHMCETPFYTRSLVVFDSMGRHTSVVAKFCGCEPEAITLLRYRLWPSSPTKPVVAFTLELMELCRSVQIEGQISLHKFCAALGGLQHFLHGQDTPRPDLYRCISRNALAEYRHHHYALLQAISSPEALARGCPICQKKPADSVISLDANFGLVHKRSSGNGSGLENTRHKNVMFCADTEVHKFVESHTSQKHSSDCSNFQAGNVLRSKNKSEKLDVFGVFGSVCHHGFPLLFVNMSHPGEKYGYPVYILKKLADAIPKLAETRTLGAGKATIMYDIACSLNAHLQKRTDGQTLRDQFKFVVPVFHSFAHSTNCQLEFGQRFVDGTRLIDGEGMERLWAYLRRFSGMTKEMSLPNRQDLLTDALLNFTHRNFGTIAEKLLLRLKRARTLQSSSLDLIQNTEHFAGGRAEEWLQRWKMLVASKETARVSLSSEEQYCTTLVLVEEKRTELTSTQDPSIQETCVATIQSLTVKAAQLQRDLKLQEPWSARESRVQAIASRAREVKKAAMLAKGRKLAVERQHLNVNMRKYADGQKIAARLLKKLHQNGQKCEAVLGGLHECGVTSSISDVKKSSSPLYATVNVLTSRQIACATAFAEHQRAKEEESAVLEDVKTVYRFLNDVNQNLQENIARIHRLKASDRAKAAGLHLWHFNKVTVERLAKLLESSFSQHVELEDAGSFDHSATQFLVSYASREPVNAEQAEELLLHEDFTLEPVEEEDDFYLSDLSDLSDDEEDV